jgi:phytoene/squalene synthetase
MLPPDLERAVTAGYLLCRLADTIEDEPTLTLSVRDALYRALLDVIEKRATPEALAEASAGVWATSSHETTLLGRADAILRVLGALPPEFEAGVLPWVAEMTRGMALYSHRRAGADGLTALLTEADLERYCYFVAGTVGHMLTDLFLAALPGLAAHRVQTLRQHAESFALGLQLVNILKDVTDDLERRVLFVPRTLCDAAGVAPASLCQPEQRERAHTAVAPIFDRARRALDDAFTYTLAIPPEASAIRLFCLLPLWMAARTVRVAHRNDAQFESGRAVKISRAEVHALIAECSTLCSQDDALTAAYAALWERPAHGG